MADGLISTGIGEVANLASTIANKFLTDKTQVEKDAAAFQLQQLISDTDLVKAQTAVDQAEAQSTDPLQHWRGALGWVCAGGYAWNFLLQPCASYICGLVAQFQHITLAVPGMMDIGPLATLTLGMLGLGGLHVAERIKGAT